MIDSLTPEQEAKIPEYREKFKQIGLSTRPTDKAKAEAALKESYAYLKLEEPQIIWADSPFAGAVLAAKEAKGSDDITEEDVRAQAAHASYGSFEAYWVALYSFIANELAVQKDNLHEIATKIVEEVGVYWTFEGLIIATEKPVEIHVKDDKLHNEDGMAIRYKDGTGVYAVNGVRKESLLDSVLSDVFDNQEAE